MDFYEGMDGQVHGQQLVCHSNKLVVMLVDFGTSRCGPILYQKPVVQPPKGNFVLERMDGKLNGSNLHVFQMIFLAICFV